MFAFSTVAVRYYIEIQGLWKKNECGNRMIRLFVVERTKKMDQ